MNVNIRLVLDDDYQVAAVERALADAVRAVRVLRNRGDYQDVETRSQLRASLDILDTLGARYADALAEARKEQGK